MLRLRPRNQHIGSNSKRKPEKFLLPQNVLDGLMPSATPQPLVVLYLLFSSELGVRMSQQKSTIAPNDAQQQQLSITTRLFRDPLKLGRAARKRVMERH